MRRTPILFPASGSGGGGGAVNSTTTVNDTDYTVTSSDNTIVITALTAPRTITLPSTGLTEGRTLEIIDESGVADQYPVVIVGQVNNGPATALFKTWGRMVLRTTGSQWRTDSWAATSIPAQITGTTYYVDSVNGSDTNAGTSPGAAWQTVGHVNTIALNAGDGILFAGGQDFSDAQLMPNGGSGYPGTTTAPCIIGSFGTGQAQLSQGVWFIGGSYMIFDNLWFSGSNGFQGGNATTLLNNITVQRCTFSDVGDTTNSTIALNTNGSNWVIRGNYIHDIPAHGVMIGGAQDGNSGGYLITDNLIVNCGLNTGLGYNCHAVYGDAHDVVIARNVAVKTGTDAFSQRYRNWTIEDNHSALNPQGITFYEYDTIGGTSVYRRNRIMGASATGVFVASASDGNPQALENFKITENVIQPTGSGTFLNLLSTNGTYEVWGNVTAGGEPFETDDFSAQWPIAPVGGTNTQTPGAVTTVTIPHGLGVSPTKFSAQAGDVNAASAPTFFVTANATDLTLTFTSALTAATSYTWVWTAAP